MHQFEGVDVNFHSTNEIITENIYFQRFINYTGQDTYGNNKQADKNARLRFKGEELNSGVDLWKLVSKTPSLG